ncbi:MAG: glycine zipper domain-containing protein [Phycisphaerales bacterium]|nr:glycine zipper domain-containing protein [Phycisphaerales bacterium]
MRIAALSLIAFTAAGLAGCETHTETGALIGGGAGAAGGAIIAGPMGAVVGGAGGAVTGALIGNEQDKQEGEE